jgi:hypothetical protein
VASSGKRAAISRIWPSSAADAVGRGGSHQLLLVPVAGEAAGGGEPAAPLLAVASGARLGAVPLPQPLVAGSTTTLLRTPTQATATNNPFHEDLFITSRYTAGGRPDPEP